MASATLPQLLVKESVMLTDMLTVYRPGGQRFILVPRRPRKLRYLVEDHSTPSSTRETWT